MIKFNVLMACITLILLSGCNSTTITEYDANGQIIKVTKTDKDPIELIISSTKDKNVFMTREVYIIGVSLSPLTATNSILSGECLYAHKKFSYASILKGESMDKVPTIFEAMQKMTTISIDTSGVQSK